MSARNPLIASVVLWPMTGRNGGKGDEYVDTTQRVDHVPWPPSPAATVPHPRTRAGNGAERAWRVRRVRGREAAQPDLPQRRRHQLRSAVEVRGEHELRDHRQALTHP